MGLSSRDAGVEFGARRGIGGEGERSARADGDRGAFGDFHAQAQRVSLHQRDDGRVLLHVLAGRNQACGDLAVKGRAHGGVAQPLLRELYIGAQGLDIGELRAQVVASGFEGGFAGVQRFLQFDEALLRDVSTLDQARGALELEARIFHLRLGLAYACGGLGFHLFLPGIETDARERLRQCRLRTLLLNQQLALVELGDNVALADGLPEVVADFGQAPAHFGAHRHGLVRLERTGNSDAVAHLSRLGDGHADACGLGDGTGGGFDFVAYPLSAGAQNQER